MTLSTAVRPKRCQVDPTPLVLIFLLVSASGCAWKFKSVRERELEAQVEQFRGRIEETEAYRRALLSQIDRLQEDLNALQDQRAREIRQLAEEKERAAGRAAQESQREAQELVEAQRRLSESLRQELGDARAKLAMTERGLILTFLDEIFFDSGKAVIKPEGVPTLQKVAAVLKETVPESPVAVEGHTDNEPIRYSGWKSNWELSVHRALAVVHHFTDSLGVQPSRLRAIGFGEYHPVTSNETAEGRRQNRRVEVVILPKALTKVKPPSS